MEPILTQDGLDKWVGAFQIVIGAFQLAVGSRRLGEPGGILAPLGALWIIIGTMMLLQGRFADQVLITGAAIALIPAVVWLAREHRAGRSRRKTKKRGQTPV